MNKQTLLCVLTSVLLTCACAASACEYKAGETKFADYANCRYGEDAIEVITLPEDYVWEQCIYYIEAFRPPKLLAVTRDENGVEKLSINDRHQIGNPCYLAKQYCDAALKAAGF